MFVSYQKKDPCNVKSDKTILIRGGANNTVSVQTQYNRVREFKSSSVTHKEGPRKAPPPSVIVCCFVVVVVFDI